MTRLHALLVLTLLHSPAFAGKANWQVLLGEDPLTGQSTCLLMSTELQSFDGQADTAIQLIFNGQVLVARTGSNIDLSYANLGLQVDNYPPHPIDRLLGETSALFETRVDKLREQFINGRSARLTLGFWPTWPKTRAVITGFNLYGFTRAWHRFQQCQQSGQLP